MRKVISYLIILTLSGFSCAKKTVDAGPVVLNLPAVDMDQFPDLNWNDVVAGRSTLYDFNLDNTPDVISYKQVANRSPLPPIFYINDYAGRILYTLNIKNFKPTVRDSLNNIIYDYDDLNGDGKVDLVLSYMGEWWLGGANTPQGGGIGRWFGINTYILFNKGNMQFDVVEIIDDPTNVQFNVTLSDWDFDGKVDILVSSMQDGIYYKNMGNNNFSRRVLTPLFKQAINVRGPDFDRDGKRDYINLYVNQKDEFGNYTSTDFSQILSVVTARNVTHYPVTGKIIEKNIYIGPNTTSAERINLVDGDGDRDLDLIIGYRYTRNGDVSAFQEYYENTGTNFIYRPNYFEIDFTLYSELQAWTYDINKDGKMDLFYPTYSKRNLAMPKWQPFWWQNTGSGFKINKDFVLKY